MLHAKNVPGRFWAECMKTAAYVINRLPQSKLGFKSPHEMLWKDKPSVSHLKVFGCVCYVFVPDHLRSKFEKKAIRCIFVGYDDARKGWRCCDPTTGKCHISRNVVFDEASAWWSPEKVELPESHDLEEVPEEIKEEKELTLTPNEEEKSSPSKTKSPWKTGLHQSTQEDPQPPQLKISEPIQGLRRTTRKIRPPPRYACTALTDESLPIEPSSYEEAEKSSEWRNAMEEEIKALNDN